MILMVVSSLIFQVFVKDVDKDTLILFGARASRVENQDAIDACIVGMLGDPKEVYSFNSTTNSSLIDNIWLFP